MGKEKLSAGVALAAQSASTQVRRGAAHLLEHAPQELRLPDQRLGSIPQRTLGPVERAQLRRPQRLPHLLRETRQEKATRRAWRRGSGRTGRLEGL